MLASKHLFPRLKQVTLSYFSHGFGGLPENYSSLAEELASNGYIVASISHTYDASLTVFPDGRSVRQASVLAAESSLDTETVNHLDQEDVNIRVDDARFVLNELTNLNADDPQNLLTGHLDLNRVGIFGHSMGGNTVVQAMLLDSRFKAGLDLDGNRLLNATLLGRWVIERKARIA
jgi:predicted dienelactone hydrolase